MGLVSVCKEMTLPRVAFRLVIRKPLKSLLAEICCDIITLSIMYPESWIVLSSVYLTKFTSLISKN